jgi:alanine racemase
LTAARLRWADVDLGAVSHNVTQVRDRLRAGTGMIAVVKAGGYGHGAVAVGREALGAGADWLAVATLEEASELRAAGIEAPVLLLGPVAEGAEREAVSLGIRLTVYEAGGAERLSRAASGMGDPVPIHLKVDTGMARLGCPPAEAATLAQRLLELPGLALEGLWTHFAEADDPASERTEAQLGAFLAVVAQLAAAGIRPSLLHCANSAAALLYPDSQLDMVRCGLPIYGYHPTVSPLEGLELRPVLSWKARLVAVHDLLPGDRVGYGGTFNADGARRVATISTGYADGYPRALSGRGELLLRGRRVPVVGRVSMDFTTVDVTAVPEAAVGDEVVIIGAQGDERITADDLAASLQTISWEVLTMIGPRVERVWNAG